MSRFVLESDTFSDEARAKYADHTTLDALWAGGSLRENKSLHNAKQTLTGMLSASWKWDHLSTSRIGGWRLVATDSSRYVAVGSSWRQLVVSDW